MAPHHQLCSIIHNAYLAQQRRTSLPFSAAARAITAVLYDEGLLAAIALGDTHGPFAAGHHVPITPDNVAARRLWIDLKYRAGEPALRRISVVSKPSRKVLASYEELRALAAARRASPLIRPQLTGQVTIVNTPLGIVELKDALKHQVGGEVLCIAV